MKETDLEKVREVTILLARAVSVEPDERFGFIVQHPFTNSIMVSDFTDRSKILNLLEEKDSEKWLNGLSEYIRKCDIPTILCFLNNPWCLTWLDFVKDYLSDKDFAELLAHSWVTEENPNMDANVKIPKLIKWFKKADKKYLMEDEDLEYYNNLPETLTLYRGVSVGRVDKGLSWTDSKEKAEWFQHRFENWDTDNGKKGHLLTVTCPKKYALAYFNTRNEQEVVLDVMAVKNLVRNVEC